MPRTYGKQPVSIATLVVVAVIALAYHWFRDPLRLTSQSRVEIFLLAGQSNMSGSDFVAPADTGPHPGIYQINAEGRVAPARHPLHFDKSFAGYGMGIPFAEAIRPSCGDCTILLVPAAAGSSTLKDWQPGGTAFVRALILARIALPHGKLKAVL